MTWDAQTIPVCVDVLRLTTSQPFCAGVVLCDGDRVLVTLNPDGLPPDQLGCALRIGGVGGGQEPGETILDCAHREAREELSISAAALLSSPVTYVHDLGSGQRGRAVCGDVPAPLLFQRKRRPQPDIPYRPGLPTGPYVYFALYLARQPDVPPHPGDDVRALLWLPFAVCASLAGSVSLGALLDQRASLVSYQPLPCDTLLWMPPEESMRVVAMLLSQHPELAGVL